MSRVLIIDNHDRFLAGLTQTLKKVGMEVLEAPCVISGVEIAKRQTPDLLVSAEEFHGLDVIDLLECRKVDPTLAEIPILVISPGSRTKLDCFRLGCDDFITLPTDESEIFFRICAVLRRVTSRGLNGQFSDVALVDLIQMLSSSKRNGVLEVEFSHTSGVLYFKEGQLCHAVVGNTEGEDALLEAIRNSLRGGSFSFLVTETEDTQNTIQKRTDHLLLFLANVIDEERARINNP